MRSFPAITALLVLMLFAGCALGKKEWPASQKSDDMFALSLVAADRTDSCLSIQVGVSGASQRLYRISIQYEQVGGEGGGCIGCPFVPRNAIHVARSQSEFVMNGDVVDLSLCELEPGVEYRFRVAGKSELPTAPLVYTDVYVAEP